MEIESKIWLWLIGLSLTFLTIKNLCRLSPSFQYYFKFFIFMIYVPIGALITIPFFFLRPRDARNMHWLTPIYQKVSPLLGIKWEMQGRERLDKDEPCVIICNHQSGLDILAMSELAIPNTAAVAKKELLYAFPFGLCAWLCGTIFINRSSSQSKEQVNKLAYKFEKTKTKLWIFPEGTRHKGSTLLPFKKGAFHIAVQHKIPIIPIVISPYSFINDEKPYFNSGKMIISVLPPVETSHCEVSDITELVEKTRDKMTTEYQRLGNSAQKILGDVGSQNGSSATAPLQNGETKKFK